ncbi:MAG: 2OG-Fe(II) oxygenase [Bacteroidia bacterium]|nr:2OG-Fe(II) oxygenase [Bacteroidia bacterium]
MEAKFDSLINSFLENKVGLADSFLDEALRAQLRTNLLALHASDQLRMAGIGNNARLVKNPGVRNDRIFWLDRTPGPSPENQFFDLIDEFVEFLNRTCYAGIRGYEFHYAWYGPGSFYKRHLDQFRSDQKRAYTLINYLTENWQEGDGGELCIYLNEDNPPKIAPLSGRAVFFRSSEIEHEVLLSHQPRLSITGWFRVG